MCVEGWWGGGSLRAGTWRRAGWGRRRRAEGSWARQGLVWGYDSRGKHDCFGEFSTAFEEMQKAFGENQVSGPSLPCLWASRKRWPWGGLSQKL